MAEAPQQNGQGELIDERPKPYAKVDVWVLRNPEITPQCKALYGLLITYGPDRIFPGHDRLARELSVTRQTVSKWMHDLRDLELIDWQRTGRSNRYRILGPARCKAKHTSDVKPGIHQMPIETDNRCKPEQTRSRSKELDPSTPDPINSPAGAENPPEPDILPPTDNPNSITNRPVESGDEHQGGNASTGSYMGDIQRRANGGESWTVPAEAGGADSFRDGPVNAFCDLIGVGREHLTGKEINDIAKVLRQVAEKRQIDAPFVAESIALLLESDWDWRCKSFTQNPHKGGFEEVLCTLIGRRLKGEPLRTDSPRVSRSGQRGAMRGSTWTEQELWEAARESLAMCPDHVLLGCATEAEFWKLTPAEFEERIQGANERAETWQAATTGDVARAIAEMGGVKIDLEWTRTRWEMREREA